MFRTFASFAIASIGLAADAEPATLTVTPEQGAQLACYIIADDFTVFDLTPLTKPMDGIGEDDYDKYSPSADINLEWKFCQYLKDTTCFARTLSMETGTQCITSEDYMPSSYELERDENNKIAGITYTQESDVACTATDGTETTYSFSATVLCDEAITGVGESQI